MPLRWVLVGLVLSTCSACAQFTQYRFEDGTLGAWRPLAGEWSVRDGGLLQSDASSPAYRHILAPDPWIEGTIEAKATPLVANRNGNVGASFGLVAKYLDDGRWCAVRYGSYGGLSLLVHGPEPQIVKLGSLAPVPGEARHAKVILRAGYLAIALDDVVLAIVHDPFADQPGRPGLFTETACRFDHVCLERIR